MRRLSFLIYININDTEVSGSLKHHDYIFQALWPNLQEKIFKLGILENINKVVPA